MTTGWRGDGEHGWDDDPTAPTEPVHGAGAADGAPDGTGRQTLDQVFYYAGGTTAVAWSPYPFEVAELGWASRGLLRLIGVNTGCVPAGEQWKLRLMALTVPLNATLAAVFTPIGLTVAYGHLSAPGIAVAALVSGFAVGLLDALVVGHWPSYGKWLTRLGPADPMPRMPGTAHRLLTLAPRLLVTLGIVFTLGLMLTFAVNATAVRQEMGTLNAQHNKDTRLSLLKPYATDIAAMQAAIPKALSAYNADLTAEQTYQRLASCELRGFPVVPGCTGHAGGGILYQTYTQEAAAAKTAAAQQLAAEQTDSARLNQDRQDEQGVQNSPQYQESMIPSTGFLAAGSAFAAYVSANHVPWWDAWRMDLLVLVLDLTPLLIKLSGGTTDYEAQLWFWRHQRATEAHRQAALRRRGLEVNDELHQQVAKEWVTAGAGRTASRLAAWRPRGRRTADGAEQPPTRPEQAWPEQAWPGQEQPEQDRAWQSFGQPAPTRAEAPGPTRAEGGAAPAGEPGPAWREAAMAASDGGAPLAAPVASPPSQVPVVLAGAGGSAAGTPDGGRGEDPFNLGRDALPRDVVHLLEGDYLLVSRLTPENRSNSDVFVAVEVPKPGQRVPNARDGSPVRAVKLTRVSTRASREEPGGGEEMSEAESLLLDYFPDDEALLEIGRVTLGHDGRIAYTMPYLPCGDLERYVYGPGPGRPRLTNGDAIEAGLTITRGLRQLWELGLSHNDVRLRNVLVTGPLQGSRDRLAGLAPGRAGKVVLADYNYAGFLNELYRDPPGLVVSALDGDPHVIRWMLEHGDHSGMPSPLGIGTDCYSVYAVMYSLLSGGLSPTSALLARHGWPLEDIQGFDTPRDVNTWRELLSRDPGLLSQDPPSLAEFGTDPAVATVLDAGVCADPARRLPRVSGPADAQPALVHQHVADALTLARASASGEWLQRPLPPLAERHPWYRQYPPQPPAGYPREVIHCLGQYWPGLLPGTAHE